jgi:hypothetical protein
MRRTLVLVTVAALATWVVDAAFARVPVLLRTPGSEFLELRSGNGRAVVTGRGSLGLNIRSGRLRIVDLPQAGTPNLTSRCRRRARRVSPTTLEIRGRNIGCVIWSGEDGGRWQAILRGRLIDASGKVRGSLTLDAVDRGPTGRFSIGADGSWHDWPRRARTYALDRQ